VRIPGCGDVMVIVMVLTGVIRMSCHRIQGGRLSAGERTLVGRTGVFGEWID